MSNVAVDNFLNFVEKQNIRLREQDILDRLQIRKRWSARHFSNQIPSVQMINNMGTIESSLIFDPDGYLNYEKFLNYYYKGYSFIIIDALDLFNETRKITKVGMDDLGIVPTGNYYFSQGGQEPSFDLHSDDYDIIVKNIYGEATWKIDGRDDLIITNQETLYLPKGVLHKVSSINKPRLSLTIGLQTMI